MSVFSRLRAVVAPVKSLFAGRKVQQQAVRLSHDRIMEIKPGNYHWKQFFDDLHFYVFLTGIPIFVTIVGVNIFIGPATLSDIPEGYEPKDYEYHRSPITRFMVKYLIPSSQEIYERNMHALQESNDTFELRRIRKQVQVMSWDRGDYQAWAYLPTHAELMTRVSIRDAEMTEAIGHPDF